MALVSIVVPVYNVEKYLKRCVDSIMLQTLQDIEIILVDDGSTDSSGKLCDELVKLDRRIRVIHKENGGLSSARNAGMWIARGKYIGFVDSDDTILNTMYEELANLIQQYQCDFVMCDYERILADGSKHIKSLEIDSGFYDKQKIVEQIYPDLIMGRNLDYGPLLSVWHCLYNLEFLKKNNVSFDEEVRWSEDNIFSAFVGYYARSFYYLKNKGLYQYYQNPGTITTSYRKDAWKVYCTMNEHLTEFFEKVAEYNFDKQLKLHIIYYACNCIAMESKRETKESIRKIKKNLSDYRLKKAFQLKGLPDVSLKLKVQLLLMKYRCATVLYKVMK